MKAKKWHVKSGDIDNTVTAKNQFEAYAAFRERPVTDFGLVVVATPAGGTADDSYPIRTSRLMYLWGREADARLFIAAGIEEGMPDTTDVDFTAPAN